MRETTKGMRSKADILAQLPAARERAEKLRQTALRAARVRYSTAMQQLMLTLGNATEVRIPIRAVAALRGTTPRERADVHVSPSGSAIRWERLDVDLSVPALLEIALGRSTVNAMFGTAGGRSTSERKAQAARLNGAKGGRPRRPAAERR
ncbi:DUF2442 domain-containing protein [Gemmatimonas sp.]|uniref:DUF2442 domain-containing protein n=2 Tax=Gemmatimonas sp. TaxID=1962908 RepID=UPI003DA56932